MEFTVKIEDDWIEDTQLISELKSQITSSLASKIIEKLLSGHVKLIEKITTDKIIQEFDKLAKEATLQFIENGKVRSGRNSSTMITVSEYIAERFENSNSYNSQKDLIERKAKEYSTEMKNRYDMMFASQLVIKLNEQGMLKEGVFESLMKKE